MSKEEHEEPTRGKLPYNGYSDEFLDRLEPNGNIPAGKADLNRYGQSLHLYPLKFLTIITLYLMPSKVNNNNDYEVCLIYIKN